MFHLYFNNKYLDSLVVEDEGFNIHEAVEKKYKIKKSDYYLTYNGRITTNSALKLINGNSCNVHIVPRLFGGKGGFGSMLRAIGAQIEKTTNREACRDLSGRRLRDINEEKRLKAWIDKQADREQEAADRRQKKLERLCQKPRHQFKDDNYDKERSELPDRLEDAVSQGLSASASTVSSGKRKCEVETTAVAKKKKKGLWLDDELDGLSSGDDVSSSGEET